MVTKTAKPVVLTLGVTGQLGRIVAEHLHKNPAVSQKVTSRKKELLPNLTKEFGDAVYMDLDYPRTFAKALEGVDRVFLLTGYSVTMLVQSKAFIDAAKNAGVKHIVHLGVFTPDHDCYDPHFAWHQLIEAYIRDSGISYTLLHPNCFLQNFTGFYGMAKHGKVIFYTKDKPVGWIALEDVGEAAAKILAEGPSKHHGKDYWFSTESLNIYEIAKIFTEVTGKKFVADARAPEQFIKDFQVGSSGIDPYFLGVAEGFVQMVDGRMGYIAKVRDDVPLLLGRKGMTVIEWAKLHKEELLSLAL